jgi:putative endonuclease
MSTRRTSIGAAGEAAAAQFFESRGIAVLDQNVRVGRDEIDLLVLIDGEVVAVEVKTGLGIDTRPWENFDTEKNERVRRAAGALSVWRIDVIAIELKRDGVTIRWLPRAG